MARKTASSSRSNVLYFTSAGESFLEKKASGAPSEEARTAPTAVSDASVVKEMVSAGSG